MATHAYCIADLHLDHGPGILQIRPQFKTIEEHDKFIVDRMRYPLLGVKKYVSVEL